MPIEEKKTQTAKQPEKKEAPKAAPAPPKKAPQTKEAPKSAPASPITPPPNDLNRGNIDIILKPRIERNTMGSFSTTAKYTPSLGLQNSRSAIHAAIDRLLDGDISKKF